MSQRRRYMSIENVKFGRQRWQLQWLVAIVALTLLAASCASGTSVAAGEADEPGPTTTSVAADEVDEPGFLPVEDLVTCSGWSFTLSSLETIEPLAERPEIAEAVSPFLDSEEGDFWPQEGWQVITVSDELALVVVLQTEQQVRDQLEGVDGVSVEDGIDDSISLSLQSAELRDGMWQWVGSSSGVDCELETPAPEGLNRVSWQVDPDGPEVTADSTMIQLLASEVECVSGEAMGDRFNEPVVVETETQVLITMTATQPEGDFFDCSGNPYESVEIALAAPLGDRELRDGSMNIGRLSDFIGDVFGIGTE